MIAHPVAEWWRKESEVQKGLDYYGLRRVHDLASEVEGSAMLATAVIWMAMRARDGAFFGLGDDPDAALVGRFWVELLDADYRRIQQIAREALGL